MYLFERKLRISPRRLVQNLDNLFNNTFNSLKRCGHAVGLCKLMGRSLFCIWITNEQMERTVLHVLKWKNIEEFIGRSNAKPQYRLEYYDSQLETLHACYTVRFPELCTKYIQPYFSNKTSKWRYSVLSIQVQ